MWKGWKLTIRALKTAVENASNVPQEIADAVSRLTSNLETADAENPDAPVADATATDAAAAENAAS